MAEVAKQCALTMKKPFEYYSKHPEEVVTNVL